MEVSVTVGFSRGLPLATSLPVALCSVLSRRMVSIVSVTLLLIPFESMKLFHLETEIRSRFQCGNVLDEDRPSRPRPGRFL